MHVVDRVSDVMQSPALMKQASRIQLARAASAGTKNALSTQVHLRPPKLAKQPENIY